MSPRALDVPWDEVDAGIRPVVRELNEAGFRTVASCQGHGRGDAWVAVAPRDYADDGVGGMADTLRTATELEAFLGEKRWDHACIVSVEWTAGSFESWVVARWWGRMPFRGIA